MDRYTCEATGAHFMYEDMCVRLTIIEKSRSMIFFKEATKKTLKTKE
jgi:hypothetical protein